MPKSAVLEAVSCILLPAAAGSAACQTVSYRTPPCSATAEGTALAAGVAAVLAASGGGAAAGCENSESAGGTAGTPRSNKPQSKGFASVCRPQRTLSSRLAYGRPQA